jgi:hypothetical protein
LRLTPGGTVWVQLSGKTALPDIDVFSSTGTFVGSLRNTPFPAMFLSERIFVAEEAREDGSTVLSLWHVSYPHVAADVRR